MKKRLCRPFGVVFVAVLLLCMVSKIPPAVRGQPPAPSFWVEPETENFTTDNATVGTLLNVTVWGSVAVSTIGWMVELGFDSSELQAVAVDFQSEFFAGHTGMQNNTQISNNAGTVLAYEVLLGRDYVGPTSGSLFSVTFEITAAPAQGQSLTSLIDPGCGVASGRTIFVDTNYAQETPLSTAPCAYTFRDSAMWSPNPTFVYCSPNPVLINTPVTCTAVVSGFNATGAVVWSSNSSTGSFSPSVCTLSSDNSSGICSTTYTDSSGGTVTITASYSGDSFNTASNGSTILEVNSQTETSTDVYCSPNPAHINESVFCGATVFGDNPTGTITWTTNSSTGFFSPSVCSLSYGVCSTVYTDSSGGTVTITASYSGDVGNTPSSGSIVLEVSTQPTESWTSVYCSPNPVHFNGPVTCTAYVSGDNPTGTITWTTNSSTGSFDSSVCTLSSGECSTTYTDRSPGTVTIAASYSGDSFNMPSNYSTILEVNEEPEQSWTYVYCSPNPVHINESVFCGATVYGFNPTGTVTWSSSSSTGFFSPSVCTLWSDISYGGCSTTYTDSSGGTVTITASYSGDANNTPSNYSTILDVNAQPEQSSTYVYCSPNPAHINLPVTCTAYVSGYSPTGTVTWSSSSSTGSFSSSVCTLSSGSCSTTYTDSSGGTVTITASYSGDADNTPSDGSTVLDVNAQPEQSSTYVYCSPNPVHINAPVYCSATVYGFNPTGTITWTTNSSTGTFSPSFCTLYSENSYGYCSTTYTDSSGNTAAITASYSGDTNNAPSNDTIMLEVNAQPEQSWTYVYCYPNPVHFNGPVTCTAYVSGDNPTGTITWTTNSSTGSFDSSVCTLSYGGCSTTYTDSSTGMVTITASYSGDADNTPSNASTILEVNEELAQSWTYVYCYPNPVHINAPVYCSVSVSGDNPTGTIVWSSDSSTGSFSSSVCDLSYGYCSTTYTDSNPGMVTITASYSGDFLNAPSNASTTLEVSTQPEQSWTYVYGPASSTYTNSPVTYTAGVNGYNPTGTVTWSSSSSTGFFSPSVCTLSSGICSTTYTDTSPGTVTITASYSGDADNAASSSSTTLTVVPEPVLPPEILLNVPYHAQMTSSDCGPAALEEVFDYYGPDVPQFQIMDVARTTITDGTYDIDLIRAAQFSNLSSTTENQARELHPFTGYPDRSLGYAALDCYGMSVTDLKVALAAGYPVIVLTTWHFRVAVGYTDQYIIFQDPYYGSMYKMTYADFSADWDYSGHWGLLVCPWQVEISNPHNISPGDTFTVNATITYPEVYPFQSTSIMSPLATSVNATITLPSGLTLAPTETAQKTYDISLGPGQSFTASWQVQCQSTGDYRIDIEAEGLVNGWMMPEPPAYPQSYNYQDRIGGTNESILAATLTPDTTPPVTTEDYDGSWQNHAFAINLTASDDMSGVLDTYYKVNGGPTEAVSVNGEPTVASPGASNTLEYWSVDWAGNEELPHKYLTDIKLDDTPPSLNNLVFTPITNVQPHQSVEVTLNAADVLSGIQNVTVQYSSDNGVSWMNQPMTLNSSTLSYEATIPGQPAGTIVNFHVTACDQAGNTATLLYYNLEFTYGVLPLSASMSCTLQPLNLGFNGQWLTFCLKPPEGYSVDSANVTSLTLNDVATANPDLTNVTVDEKGTPELLVSFNRTAVSQSIMSLGVTTGNVTLSFNGRLEDGSLFEGTCTLCVHMPGDVNMDGKVDIRDINSVARTYGSSTGQPGYKSVLDENEDGRIDIRDVALIAKNYGKTYS